MSGDDVLYWLNDIWYDVTHLATADIPSLLFRLFVLLAAIVIARKLIEIVLRIFGDVLHPFAQLVRNILRGIWWVLSAPFWVPRNWLRRLRHARKNKAQARRGEVERLRQQQEEQDRRDAEQNQKAEEYQRMKALLSPLE